MERAKGTVPPQRRHGGRACTVFGSTAHCPQAYPPSHKLMPFWWLPPLRSLRRVKSCTMPSVPELFHGRLSGDVQIDYLSEPWRGTVGEGPPQHRATLRRVVSRRPSRHIHKLEPAPASACVRAAGRRKVRPCL